MTIWYMRPLGVQCLVLGYRTGGAWNETGYSNPEFDEKLDKALAIADPDKRKEAMKDLEQILQDSGIIIQPYWQKVYSHMTKNVHNYGVHPTFEMDLQKVWLDSDS
jgi:peptide/nickel transport system substrate-binding protein